MYQNCEHKNLKYFTETTKVVCLDCGYTWENGLMTSPFIPYIAPTPAPDYPIYPVVTWSNVGDSTN